MPDARSPSELSIDELVATIRHIIAEDEERGDAPAVPGAAIIRSPTGDAAANEAGAGTENDDADDILELTQAINEDGSVRQLAPIGPSLRAVLRGDVASPAQPAPEGGSSSSTAPDQRRIADVASRAAAATARPAAAPPADSEPQKAAGERTVDEVMRSLGAGDRTVEEIVRDMLEPMLRSWLDEHLSTIVERQVRAELARTIDKPGF